MNRLGRTLILILGMASIVSSQAKAPRTSVHFIVVDPALGLALSDGYVRVETIHSSRSLLSSRMDELPDVVVLPLGKSILIRQEPPVKDIYIKVTASRLRVNPAVVGPSAERTRNDIAKFQNTASGDSKVLTQGQAGVAEDSSGQQHIRGEHAEVAYVIDGVPLPDTLSGRQTSIIVPSTIERFDILTGGFAPEFGGQTAAILDIETIASLRRSTIDNTLGFGSFQTLDGDSTASGPLASRGSYVLNLGASRTNNFTEPLQPDRQDAHNRGDTASQFGKFRWNFGTGNLLTLTVSRNPGNAQVPNRTGLPDSFAAVGEGYGFLGARNADGSRPDVTPESSGLLGAQTLLLPSQQDAGQDINLRDISEFATIAYNKRLPHNDAALLALTMLHSGQEIRNHNPIGSVLDLPIDSPIEFSPTITRNAHHLQLNGSYSAIRGPHRFKMGFLVDDQSGQESYRLEPGSRLALDALAALDPNLVPPGSFDDQLDINGNRIFNPSSSDVPTLRVRREGSYRAAFIQDTWQISKSLAANFGLRADAFRQSLDLGQAPINVATVSPRLNFSYSVDPKTAIRWSYNRLFNTPPLAQGAVIGQPIEPEILDQYDLGAEHEIAARQTVRLAYYAKQIRNQIDTGLLIPGSLIGAYSSVNLQRGGVHGVELSYVLGSGKNGGWDGYLNYTYSAAKPNGQDNTGADVPDYNDHDQRQSVGLGLAYSWKNGATAAFTLNHGSGLASSPTSPEGPRNPRTQVDIRLASAPNALSRGIGFSVDVQNLFDARTVINFQSAFSGTRFQQGRRILFSVVGKW